MAQSKLKSGEETYSSSIDKAENYIRWVLSNFEPYYGRSIMEVGLGHGAYRKYLPENMQYTGIDVDEECIQQASRQYPDDKFIQADITDPHLGLIIKNRKIDTILCINVLEHIKNDEMAIHNMLKQLPKNGKLLIFVPAFNSLYTDLDRLAGHFRRYKIKEIHNIIPSWSKLIRAHYFNAVGGLGWWFNRFAKHDSLDSASVNAQIKYFDKYVVPVSRVIDIIIKKYFGQSLVWVIEKQ